MCDISSKPVSFIDTGSRNILKKSPNVEVVVVVGIMGYGELIV
jgi:hypothetical protein